MRRRHHHDGGREDDDDKTPGRRIRRRRRCVGVFNSPQSSSSSGRRASLVMTFLVLFTIDGMMVESFSLTRSPIKTLAHGRNAIIGCDSIPTSRLYASVVEQENEVFDADKEEALTKRAKLQAAKRQQGHSYDMSNKKNDPEWTFFDTARIHVSGGNGGTGCVAFRREKGEPRGGPSGGRGGRGGNVYLQCDSRLNTLTKTIVHVRATHGKNGQGKNRNGSHGRDVVLRVPPGTVIRELHSQRVAGELLHDEDGSVLLVARGGRGGRGNAAFLTQRQTAPKLAERGEPGSQRWLSLELRLVADVGLVGLPNAGKSTLLAATSAAKPKIANYPFTTTVPNLGVCTLGEGQGLVLCDIPGLIEGASRGAGMGGAFLRHVQRCRVLLHVVDGSSENPLRDFETIQHELQQYDECLAQKPQVVVLNKMDIPEVQERAEKLLPQLQEAAGHSRVLPISAATTDRVTELMSRLAKFCAAQPEADLPPLPPEIDFASMDMAGDADDFTIQSDPSYPGQWRITGQYIEQIAKMTHWEYPQALERFGRQLDALGISDALQARGAQEGDLIMIEALDFEFAPTRTSPYIPNELLEDEEERRILQQQEQKHQDDEERPWRPFPQGGYLDVDVEELDGFAESQDWELLEFGSDDDEIPLEDDFSYSEDELWTA